MNLLFVSFLHPWPPENGGRQRVYHLSRGLSERHSVHLVTLLPSPEGDRGPWEEYSRDRFASIRETDVSRWVGRRSGGSRLELIVRNTVRTYLDPLPRYVRNWVQPEVTSLFRELCDQVPFDIAWVDSGQVAHVLGQCTARPMVVDLAEVQSESGERNLASYQGPRRYFEQFEHLKTRRFERQLPVTFSRVTVCKEEDRQFFSVHSDRVRVIPNGVNAVVPCDPAKAAPGSVLFVGALDYEPNVDAVNWFVEQVLPKLREARVHLTVVGGPVTEELRRLESPSCTFVGRVPDLRPYYEAASVVIAPMRLGSGTRLKVLEALAHGKPLVATQTGVEGLGLVDGRDYLRGDDPEALSRQVLTVLGDPATAADLGQVGHATVMSRFRWEQSVDQLDALLREL